MRLFVRIVVKNKRIQKKKERRMSVFDGQRLFFHTFFLDKKGEIEGLNYKCIVLLLRFLTVEIHKKMS